MNTNEMSITDLKAKLPEMSDADVQAAYVTERTTEGHKERAGALDAIKEAANKRGLQLTLPNEPGDAQLSQATPGAQPVVNGTEQQRDEHAETLKAINARLDELEAAGQVPDGKEFNARDEVLKLHRGLEALAGHLNFRLPT